MSAPKISLIISTYESPAALEKVLQGVELQSRKPAEILIADDGSGPATRALIEKWQPRLSFRHVWHEDNGFRKTMILNKAVVAATGDYLVFTDGDCVPHPRFVEDHAALAERGFWVQGRRCFVKEKFVREFEPGRTRVLGWMFSGRITGAAKGIRLPFPLVRRDTAQRGIIGCNLAAWREDVVLINGFDEEYSGWGIGEDSDLGTRLYHVGRWRKFVHAHAVVFHLNHPTSPRDHVERSLSRLDETIRSGKVRCERGLDQYLPRTRVS